MRTSLIIAIIFVSLGLILAAIPQNTTVKYKLDPEQMLAEVNNREIYFSPDEVAKKLIEKDPLLVLIDIRSTEDFEKFSLPNAINIPLTDLLNDEYQAYLDQGYNYNVFYSNGTTDALKAWMITKQLGWENNYILQGGLNYFAQLIMNPELPKSTSADEEMAKYEFRKGAQQALFGGTSISNDSSSTPSTPRPPIIRKEKKKRVQGGC